MAYAVNFTKQALKDLQRINEPVHTKIRRAIRSLAEDPRPNGCKKLKGREGYRIRIGNYRVIYEIFDDILLVEIVNLGDRKDVYD